VFNFLRRLGPTGVWGVVVDTFIVAFIVICVGVTLHICYKMGGIKWDSRTNFGTHK